MKHNGSEIFYVDAARIGDTTSYFLTPEERRAVLAENKRRGNMELLKEREQAQPPKGKHLMTDPKPRIRGKNKEMSNRDMLKHLRAKLNGSWKKEKPI